MIRAGLTQKGGHEAVRLLARVPFEHAAFDLTHALSSLSVAACRLRQEVVALQDPTIAAQYLATAGAAPTRAQIHTLG
jgi:hypothetical protein